MGEQVDISVVISTYDRCELLGGALESVVDQETGGVRYEVIVVDNNSSDKTRQVIESFIARGHSGLRYVFEGKQGISHGRNAGIANARAQIIAFTDDDVRVASDWITSIKRALDEHPEVELVGGKILPRWTSDPPAWLTRDHWWPLALLDYGDEPFYVNADNPACLPTANAAFRRNVFEQVGLFSPDFPPCEDMELLVRFWRAGGQGIYMPNIIVTAQVQPERMKKAYHRRWNNTNGKFSSLMRLADTTGPDGRLVKERPDVVTLFGVPASIYRRLMVESIGWLAANARRRESRSLQYENHVWYLIGYIAKRYEQNSAQRKHSVLAEVRAFAKALLRKKILSRRAT